MKELETLANQIVIRTKEAGQKKIIVKENELNEKLEASRIQFVAYQKNQKAAIEVREKAEYERQTQSLRNKKRNALLEEKQNIMTQVYNGAVEKMAKWNTNEFQAFANQVLSQFEGKTITVITGEKSTVHFTEALMAKYPHAVFSKETVPGKAGFIVELGGIDYNYFFDQIVAEIKKDFTPKLASLAFQKDE